MVERLLNFLLFAVTHEHMIELEDHTGFCCKFNSKPILCRGALHMLIQNVYGACRFHERMVLVFINLQSEGY